MFEILYIVFMMVLLFGITIFVHEWGHFIVARKCGLVVETFSIGMGPALWKKEIGGIVYKIGAFPIGGYVSLPQLDPAGMERMQGENENDRAALPEVSPWKKIAVALAGPLCNIVLALFIAGIVAASHTPTSIALVGSVEETSEAFEQGLRPGDQVTAVNGNPTTSWYDVQVEGLLGGGETNLITLTLRSGTETKEIQLHANPADSEGPFIDGVYAATPCVLGQITPDSPASKAGIQPDDLITSFAGTPVIGWSHFTDLVMENENKTAEVTVLRDNKPLTLSVTPEYNEELDRVLIGVRLGGQRPMPWSLSGSPLEQIKADASSIFRLLGALTNPPETKQAAKGLGGPISIFAMIYFALSQNIIVALGLIRFLNINLAVLNLLPIPVLDGGHICFALWEGITKRKPHPKLVILLINTFAILLLGAMLVLSWRDVGRFIPKAPATSAQESAESAEGVPDETTSPVHAEE